MIIAASAVQIAQKMLKFIKNLTIEKQEMYDILKGPIWIVCDFFFAFQSIAVAIVRFCQMRLGPQNGTP